MRCHEFRELLDCYLEDSLDEARREAFRNHVRFCASCRQLALAADPSLLFVTLEPGDEDPEQVERCVAAVVAQIRQDNLARRLRRPRPHLAAAAALLVGVGLIATWQIGRDREAVTTASPTPAAGAAATTAPAPPPEIQVDMPGEGVRVYQFADDVHPNTAVCYIVTPALES